MTTRGLDGCDANYRRATSAFIATSKTGEVLESQDLTLTNTGAPIADFNLVFPKRPAYKIERTLDRAARFFGERQLPYRVNVRADLAEPCREQLLGRGFSEIQPVPGMLLAPIPEIPELPAGLEVRQVEGDEVLMDFQRVAFEGFGLPAAAAPLFLTRQFLELTDVALCVGYAEGEAVATAALVGSDAVAGIYWVATLERFRGRGYGAALTWQAVRAGRERGYALASLQASQMGRPVYARMGFVADRDYAQFESPGRARQKRGALP